MRQQSKHHKISILSHDAVAKIWIVIGLLALFSKELHDFVFSFSRHVRATENDGKFFPFGIRRKLVLDKVFQMLGEFGKKGSSGCDLVGVKGAGGSSRSRFVGKRC